MNDINSVRKNLMFRTEPRDTDKMLVIRTATLVFQHKCEFDQEIYEKALDTGYVDRYLTAGFIDKCLSNVFGITVEDQTKFRMMENYSTDEISMAILLLEAYKTDSLFRYIDDLGRSIGKGRLYDA